jgi:hypothetical protein
VLRSARILPHGFGCVPIVCVPHPSSCISSHFWLPSLCLICASFCVGCKYFNDECLLLATQSSTTHLTSLAIAGCEDVTDAGLVHVAEHCPGLTAFDAAATLITDTGLMTLTRSCRGITSLQLKKCNFITDVGVITATSMLTELRSVDLSGCVLVTDAAVRAVAANCPKLRELDVTNCPLVTKAAVAELGATNPDLACHSFWEFYLP